MTTRAHSHFDAKSRCRTRAQPAGAHLAQLQHHAAFGDEQDRRSQWRRCAHRRRRGGTVCTVRSLRSTTARRRSDRAPYCRAWTAPRRHAARPLQRLDRHCITAAGTPTENSVAVDTAR